MLVTSGLERDNETFKPDSELLVVQSFGCGTAGVDQGFNVLEFLNFTLQMFACAIRCLHAERDVQLMTYPFS